MNIDSIIHDKSFELEHLTPGALAGLPDGSDAEVKLEEDGSGHFVLQLPDGAFIVTPFASGGQGAAALSVTRASIYRVL